MKLVLFMVTITTMAFANIPVGTYKVNKIQCKSGHTMKLGGKFMTYDIFLNVDETKMKMTAVAKSGSWAPFKLNCTQVNEGDFTYTQENKYEGELLNTSVKCNAKAWTAILKKKLFGVEEFGEFNYEVDGKNLTIYKTNSSTAYSCDAEGDYPVYYYSKIK